MNTTKITKRSNTKQILKTTIITIIITIIKPSSSTDMHSYPPTPPPFKPNPNHTWYTPNLDNPWDFELNDDYNLDVPPTPEIPKLRRDQSIKTIINKMMANYKKEEPPSLDSATEVQLGIFVISFYSINEQTMDFSVSMYLRQQWTDPRLRLNVDADVVSLRLGDSRYQEIWVPDTFLRNEKAANFHQVTVDNRLLKLSPNGVLWYVTKITATLACPMNLLNFPMDTQECSMLFESFGYTYETMFFRTLNLSGTVTIEIAKDLQLPQFFIKNYTVINCDEDHNQTEGAFPCLNFRFILKRDIGYFLIQVYVPSILIVILSWVSFWIHADASPARVSIGLLTVLTTTTMSSGARATLPRVSYIKALDVWMIVCLLFVFLSLIEYAVVNVAARRTLKPAAPRPLPKPVRRLPPLPPFRRSTKAAIQPDEVSEEEERAGRDVGGRKFTSDLSCLHFCKGKKNQKTVKDGRYQARQFDKMARKIFPFSFLLFNIVYWTYYFVPAMWDD